MPRPIRKRKKKPGEQGQALLEFLLVTTMILTMIFVFVQLAWGIAYGHYVHYSTFMAARAYMASAQSEIDQREAGAATIRRLLKKQGGDDIFPFIAKARAGDERDSKGPEDVQGLSMGPHSEMNGKERRRGFSWAYGVQYNWKLKLFLLPLSSFVAKDGEGNAIQPGSSQKPAKTIEWKGAIPFTSDSFLGKEDSHNDCLSFMSRMSSNFGISRGDNAEFIEDNGC